MVITLYALKETLDNVAPLVKFRIKIIFNPEIDFIGNAHRCRVLFKIITDGGVSPISKNIFARKINVGKKLKQGCIICIAVDNFEQTFKKTLRTPKTEFVINAVP